MCQRLSRLRKALTDCGQTTTFRKLQVGCGKITWINGYHSVNCLRSGPKRDRKLHKALHQNAALYCPVQFNMILEGIFPRSTSINIDRVYAVQILILTSGTCRLRISFHFLPFIEIVYVF